MPQRLSDVLLNDLVPETREWNGGEGIDLLSWLQCLGSIEHAIAYGELFWPEFVEFDGCILFAGFDAESYRGFMSQMGGDKRAVETVMNHRHILDLFTRSDSKPTRPQVVYLGRLLQELWSAKLQRDFPRRKLTVNFSEKRSDDLLDYEVTVYQEHA